MSLLFVMKTMSEFCPGLSAWANCKSSGLYSFVGKALLIGVQPFESGGATGVWLKAALSFCCVC